MSSMGALSLIPACKPYYATAYAHIKQDQRAEFMRVLTRDAPEIAKIGMVSGGSWESITGDTPFIIHLWQYKDYENYIASRTKLGTLPQFKSFYTEALPTLIDEIFRHVVALPYCPVFNTDPAQTVLCWNIQAKRECFAPFFAKRAALVELLKARGWNLSAGWRWDAGCGDLCEVTEMWSFRDETKVLTMINAMEDDPALKTAMAEVKALIQRDTRNLMRPTVYGASYLKK